MSKRPEKIKSYEVLEKIEEEEQGLTERIIKKEKKQYDRKQVQKQLIRLILDKVKSQYNEIQEKINLQNQNNQKIFATVQLAESQLKIIVDIINSIRQLNQLLLQHPKLQTRNFDIAYLQNTFNTYSRFINKKQFPVKINNQFQQIIKTTQVIFSSAVEIIKQMAESKKGCCRGINNQLKKQLEEKIQRIKEIQQFWNYLIELDAHEGYVEVHIAPQFLELDQKNMTNDLKQFLNQELPQQPDPVIIYKESSPIMQQKQEQFKKEDVIIKPQIVEKVTEKIVQIEKKVNVYQEDNMRKAHELMFGLGRPKMESQALAYYEEEAKKLNPSAFNILGQLYFKKKGPFSINIQKAAFYFQEAIKRNDSHGWYMIGKMIEKKLISTADCIAQTTANQPKLQNLSKEKPIYQAIYCYTKAGNHLDALTDLGYIYEFGVQSKLRTIAIQNDNLQEQSLTFENESISSNFMSESQIDISSTDSNKNQEIQKSQFQQQVLQDISFINKQIEHTSNESKWLVEPKLNKAIDFYMKAKKENFPRALNNLARLYLNNFKEDKNKLSKGLKYLQRAHQSRYIKATVNLGILYEKGMANLIEQNSKEAKKYFKIADAKGDVDGKFFLTYQKLKKVSLISDEPEKEFKLYKQCIKNFQYVAANRQNSYYGNASNFYLGYLHENGFGTDSNILKAFQFYVKSSRIPSYPNALNRLGDFYHTGNSTIGIERNFSKALEYYKAAAKLNFKQAYLNLGTYFEEGFAGIIDINLAKQNFDKAAQLGDNQALFDIGLLYDQNKIDDELEDDEKKSKSQLLYKQAAQQGNYYAMQILQESGKEKNIETKDELSKEDIEIAIQQVNDLNSKERNSQNQEYFQFLCSNLFKEQLMKTKRKNINMNDAVNLIQSAFLQLGIDYIIDLAQIDRFCKMITIENKDDFSLQEFNELLNFIICYFQTMY